MSVARSRLAALAATTGYPPDLLQEIKNATLPARTAAALTDAEIRQLAEAVDVLAHKNGYTAGTVRLLLDDHQQRHG